MKYKAVILFVLLVFGLSSNSAPVADADIFSLSSNSVPVTDSNRMEEFAKSPTTEKCARIGKKLARSFRPYFLNMDSSSTMLWFRIPQLEQTDQRDRLELLCVNNSKNTIAPDPVLVRMGFWKLPVKSQIGSVVKEMALAGLSIPEKDTLELVGSCISLVNRPVPADANGLMVQYRSFDSTFSCQSNLQNGLSVGFTSDLSNEGLEKTCSVVSKTGSLKNLPCW
ncbi:hypothetical protein [Chitinimonas sp.]|uniref:hypothetical protein n=1 Tax=Chitinimonas sp. TaxID=1934313 RepID=UPI0035B4E20D